MLQDLQDSILKHQQSCLTLLSCLADLRSFRRRDIACHHHKQRIGRHLSVNVNDKLFPKVFNVKDPIGGATRVKVLTDFHQFSRQIFIDELS